MTAMLYVTQDDLSKHSGYAFRVDRLRRAFERAGASVEVVGYCSDRPSIPCTFIQSRSRLRRLWPLWKGLVSPAGCIVITSIGAPYNGLYSLLARLRGKRVLYDTHDLVQYVLPDTFGAGWRIAMPWIAFSERLIGYAATDIITASPTAKDYYAARHRGHVRLAYNIRTGDAVEIVRPREIREEFGWRDATVIVYAGGLQRHVRGIERQIEAVTAARAQGANVVLLLLGYGDRAYFESLGRSLAGEGALRFMKDVSPELMRGILRQCDLAVSSEPIGYLMPSKYFDYVTSGVRIVAIDDNRDVVRSLGEFVDRYDGSTESLVRYLSSAPGRMDEPQTERAREYVRELDRATDAIAREIVTRAATLCDEEGTR